MNSRERVLSVINQIEPDRVPVDLLAVPEAWEKLFKYFDAEDKEVVRKALEIDIRWVDPPYMGKDFSQSYQNTGSIDDISLETTYLGWGGSELKIVENPTGVYEDVVRYATAGAKTTEDIDRLLKLPNIDDYDFSVTTNLCKENDDYCLAAGEGSVLYFPTLVRSMEDIFLEMVIIPEMAHHLIKRISDWFFDFDGRLLKAADGRLDILRFADDFSSQRGPLMSMEMFRTFFKEPLRKLIKQGKDHGCKIYFHCCGSAYFWIDELIEMGVDILDPVQTTSIDMSPKKLKEEFGGRISFNGGVNTQDTLPHRGPGDVIKESKELVSILGRDGGYILGPCHFVQSDVPVENIIALYKLENRKV